MCIPLSENHIHTIFLIISYTTKSTYFFTSSSSFIFTLFFSNFWILFSDPLLYLKGNWWRITRATDTSPIQQEFYRSSCKLHSFFFICLILIFFFFSKSIFSLLNSFNACCYCPEFILLCRILWNTLLSILYMLSL